MPYGGCPSPAELADFHAGRPSADRIVAVGRHLDFCPACQQVGSPSTIDHAPPTDYDREAGCRLARHLVERIPGPGPGTGPGVGERVGDFRLVRELGRGGMGIVYEAEQLSLGRRVAVKLVLGRGTADPDLMRRFEREAKAVGRLHHTNIVPVFGVGEYDGGPFYAMQLIRGAGLNEVIDAVARRRRGPPGPGLADELARGVETGDYPSDPSGVGSPASTTGPAAPGYWHRAAALIAQAAAGVGHAHDQGVLHRDIKPSNLLLDTQGTVWVTDFGLAKTDDAADLTHTGDLLGTLRYMPPEAFNGKTDRRADVYALGLTLYELLALRPAFTGIDRVQVMRAVMTADAPRLRAAAPGVPRDLETIVAKAIDRDPGRRYQTAHALADDLRRFVRDEPIRARRVGPAEQLVRWARHNRGLAAALAGLAVLLTAVTVASVLAADRFRGMAKAGSVLAASEGRLRQEAQDATAAVRSNLYAAEMNLAARVAEQPTGLPRLRELVSHWRPAAGETAADPRGWEWRLFRNLSRPEALVRTDRAFHAVAWSPDGSRLAVGVDDTIELLDPAGGAVISAFRPAPGLAHSLRWSADGRRLAVGYYGGGVSVLDARTGATVYHARHGTEYTVVCLHPDGNLLASHSNDRTVRVHDVAAGKVVAVLPQAVEGLPREFAFSPDGRRLATARAVAAQAGDGVALWDTADWTLSRVVAAGLETITTVGWLDDRRLALGTPSAGILVWDAVADRAVVTLPADRQFTASLDLSAGGRRAAGGDWGRSVRVWDTDTGRLVALCRGHTQKIQSVTVSPDGRRVAATATERDDKALRVWDLSAGQPVRAFDPPAAGRLHQMAGLDWHPDGRRVAGTTTGSATAAYDAAAGTVVGRRRGCQLVWSASGTYAATHDEADVFVWADGRPEPVRSAALLGFTKTLAWHPADDRLAIRVGRQIWVWEPAMPAGPVLVSGEREPPNPDPFNYPGGGVAWRPDGHRLAFGVEGPDGWAVRVFDPATRTADADIPATPLTIRALGWSPDGTRIAVAGDDPTIRVLDPATGATVQKLSGHTFTVRGLAYSPGGTRLASAGLDGTVVLWDTATGRLVLQFESGEPACAVAWSRDGTKLAALLETGVVKVWDGGGSD